MKMYKVIGALGAPLLAALLSGTVLAAEKAAGVKEFMGKTLQTTKEAQAAAAAGNKDACLAAIKQAKQYYKEITGDAAGKPLQDAMKKVKEGQARCEAGQPSEAAPILGEAVATMEKVNAAIR
ncbi:hypothetical protein [Candidatus Methylocalor cossyra]|uniref:Uncharacterized protein n=1 Tax=Candidatus Methylocalor cossyra TaxID=3108543 RepID=A0ABM9NKY6_9GAMM